MTDQPSSPLLDQLLPGNLSLLASPEDQLALAGKRRARARRVRFGRRPVGRADGACAR